VPLFLSGWLAQSETLVSDCVFWHDVGGFLGECAMHESANMPKWQLFSRQKWQFGRWQNEKRAKMAACAKKGLLAQDLKGSLCLSSIKKLKSRIEYDTRKSTSHNA
jgi:hypothetical protein